MIIMKHCNLKQLRDMIWLYDKHQSFSCFFSYVSDIVTLPVFNPWIKIFHLDWVMAYSNNELTICFSDDIAFLYIRFKHNKTAEDPDELIENICAVCNEFDAEESFTDDLIKTFSKSIYWFHEKNLQDNALARILKNGKNILTTILKAGSYKVHKKWFDRFNGSKLKCKLTF